MNSSSESRQWWLSSATGLMVVLSLSTLVRVFLWRQYEGFAKGDEVEILETAFRYGVGLGYEPWEIRNLTLPLLLAAPLRLLAGLGVTSTDVLVDAAVAPFVVAGTLNILLVVKLAGRWSTDARVPVLAGALYGVHWLLLVYGSAAFPRVISTTTVLAAVLLVSCKTPDDEYSRGAPVAYSFLAGALVGVAFAIRYSEGLYLFPLLAVPLFEGSRCMSTQRMGMILTGFAGSACLFVGLVDWLTWGSPFASLTAFVRFTLVERQSSSIVVSQPSWWYLKRLLHWLPVSAIPLLWMAGRDRAAGRCWLFVVPVVAGLSLVHHKELRYLQGVWPFLAILTAVGAADLMRRRKALAWALLLLTVTLGASRTTMVQGRSMAAVDAAWHLALGRPRKVALSQVWAYGGRLNLSSWDVLDLPLEVEPSDLQRLPESVDVIGIYEDRLTAAPELRRVLSDLGFTLMAEFRRSRSRPVVLFERLVSGPARKKAVTGGSDSLLDLQRHAAQAVG